MINTNETKGKVCVCVCVCPNIDWLVERTTMDLVLVSVHKI